MSASMSKTEPMKPSPFAFVTAVARSEPAKPPIGALAMRGEVVHGYDFWSGEGDAMLDC